jgi:hypothetical protein
VQQGNSSNGRVVALRYVGLAPIIAGYVLVRCCGGLHALLQSDVRAKPHLGRGHSRVRVCFRPSPHPGPMLYQSQDLTLHSACLRGSGVGSACAPDQEYSGILNFGDDQFRFRSCLRPPSIAPKRSSHNGTGIRSEAQLTRKDVLPCAASMCL